MVSLHIQSLTPASPFPDPSTGGKEPSSAPGEGPWGLQLQAGTAVCKGKPGLGRKASSPGLRAYRKEGWRRGVWSKDRVRLGAGKVERGRAEDEWDWELPRSGGEEEPHEPTSHVSREPSLPSRQLPAGRRPSAAGGPGGAGRGTLRTRAQGTPKALGPSLRQRPGRRRVEMGGAGGEALPRGAQGASRVAPGKDRKSTRLNSSHTLASRMPSSA